MRQFCTGNFASHLRYCYNVRNLELQTKTISTFENQQKMKGKSNTKAQSSKTFMFSNVYNLLYTRLLVYSVTNLTELRFFAFAYFFLAYAVAMKMQSLKLA